MNTLAHPGADVRNWRQEQHRITVGFLDLLAWSRSRVNWRALGLLACWGLLTALGSIFNSSLDFAVLRAQVAVATGALSSAVVLAERWASDPDGIGKGCAFAALAAATSSLVSSI